MSQADFALIGGAHRKSQGNYELGERSPDAIYLAAIAEAGADIRYIVTGERDGPAPEVLSTDERELLGLFRAAPLAVKAAAIGALQGGSTKKEKAGRAMKVEVGQNHGQIVEGGLTNHGPVTFGKSVIKKS